jgi:hypothetical protein
VNALAPIEPQRVDEVIERRVYPMKMARHLDYTL